MTLVQFKPFALESTSSFIMAYLYCHFWGSKCFQFARKCDVRFLERPVLKKRSTADLLPAWQQHASLVLKNLYIWGVLPSFSNEATSDSGEPLVLYASVQLPLGRTTGCQRQHISDVCALSPNSATRSLARIGIHFPGPGGKSVVRSFILQ